MLVIGHMAGHVLDGDCRILRMRIRQLVIMRRKQTPAILPRKRLSNAHHTPCSAGEQDSFPLMWFDAPHMTLSTVSGCPWPQGSTQGAPGGALLTCITLHCRTSRIAAPLTGSGPACHCRGCASKVPVTGSLFYFLIRCLSRSGSCWVCSLSMLTSRQLTGT